ncbi:MAG: cupin domain-containing protein [Rhodospirillales bacterium]
MSDLLTKGKFRRPINRKQVAAEWGARGYSCDAFIDPPGRAWIDFRHRSNELVTVIEGRLEITVNGERIEAMPGDEILIARGSLHSVRNVDAGTTRWLYGYDGAD